MRYSVLAQVALALAGLSGTVSAMGMGAIRRELRLAAEMGVNPDSMLKRRFVPTEANQAESDNVVAKTVSVRETKH
jgi:hypothetical protein